ALERGAVPDRDEDVLERDTARVVRVRVTRGDRLDPERRREVAQERVPARVAALVRPLELDEEPPPPEGTGDLGGRVRIADGEPVPGAAGEADEALAVLEQELEVEARRQR